MLGSLFWLAASLQDAPTPQDTELIVAEGLEVTTWAESPHFFNPSAIDVDSHGRIWVAEAVNYRKWGGRNPGRDHPEGDRIVVLEDSDGDGRCDSSRVFVQDPDLTSPLGIAVIGERVFVSCSPNLFVYRDADGDGEADEREVFLSGFGGHNHDHGLHSIIAGPDGELYFNAGNAGPHLVTDAGGWSLRSGSYYNGGGEKIADNKPGLVSDDGLVWTGGIILRVGQDANGLGVLAHNFRNNYEVALDSFGNLFQSDNDDDGNRSCRTMFCMEGGNYGYVSEDGTRSWQYDRRPGQKTTDAHWHRFDPGVAPPGTINGAGGPTGVAVYEGDLLNEWFGGAVLNADAGAGVVYAHTPKLDGAGYDLASGDLIRAKESSENRDSTWFRPSDVAVGLNGEIYVADWYDPGVGGHWAGDKEAYGRILRIAPEGFAEKRPTISTETTEDCLAALRSPAVNVRELGRAKLAVGGPEATRALETALEREANPRHRARLLWILIGNLGSRDHAKRALADPDPELRVTALRALARSHGGVAPISVIREYGLAKDSHPAVRREVLLQLRGAEFEEVLPELLALCRTYDGLDRWYLEAIGLAARGHEEELFAELSAEMGDVPANWSPEFSKLAWRLHAEGARSAFEARALNPVLAREARREAIDALAFMNSRDAAETVTTLAQVGPEDLREHAMFWVKHRATNSWREYGQWEQLEPVGFGDAELVFESDVVNSGTIPIAIELEQAEQIWLVATDGGNGNGCDWVDWIAPKFVRGEEEFPLTQLAWLEAEAEWGSVNVGSNAVGDPLRIAGRAYQDGIGAHAFSRIGWSIPEGCDRFVCEAGVDEGGTSQAGGQATSVQFQVYVKSAPTEDTTLALLATLNDEEADTALRAEAAKTLALDPRGALHLIEASAKGKLADSLRAIVAEQIFQNPDISVRALASAQFQRPGEADRKLPPVADLLALEGHAKRGQALFFEERAQCATCHSYQLGDTTRGAEIGPNLTAIREKLGRAEILDAILNPSAAIAFGYDTWLLETDDGLLYSGFLIADGQDVVIKDTRGMRTVLASDEITHRTKQELSTMPQGVALDLSAQEIADLVAFLSTDMSPPPQFDEEIALFNGEDLTGWTFHLNKEGAQASDVWSVADGVLECRGNPIGYLRTIENYTNFHLTLEWRFPRGGTPGNSGVLLRMIGEDKVWPRSIEAQLLNRDAGDIFNIGEFDMEVDPARNNGRRTTRMQPCSEFEIGEWNRYDILLHGGRLELRVNGVLQNTADWCAEVPGKICLQSEGVPIHYRNIRLRKIQ